MAAQTATVAGEQSGGSWMDSGVTLVVAVVAAAASYGHMLHVAHLAGESLWIARAWPITVDGLAIAALRRGDRGRPWLLLALAVSVASNVLAGYPEVVADIAPAVKAWPPLALFGCHVLLHGHRHDAAAVVAPVAKSERTDDAVSSPPRGAGSSGDVTPQRQGPAPSKARARSSSSTSGRRKAPAADVAELLPVARQVAATLAAVGGTLTRDTLVAGLRAKGYSVANARAGELLAILRRPGNGNATAASNGNGGNPAPPRPATALALPAAGDRSATTVEIAT